MQPRACVGGHLRSAAHLSSSIRLLVSPLQSQGLQPHRQLSTAVTSSATASASIPAAAASRLSCRQHSSTLGATLSACRGKRGAASVAGGASANGDAAANDTWLVVGLGNPGPQYEDTRHNIGFKVIDRLGADAGISVDKKQHNALVGKGRLHGLPVLLAKPTTFMNSSGKAVRKLMDYYKVQQDHVLVIYDDLDLPTAKTRLRAKGGHGGHNGMRSIVAMLGNSQDFARIRVGIGRPAGQRNIAEYVLEDFSRSEWEDMQFGIQDALDIVKAVLVEGMERAISGVRA